MEVETVADDLLIGAVEIARKGFDDKINDKQVYRLAEERDPPWPIFRLRGKLAARRSALIEEIARREALATGRSK
jgi:hypothetical protein